MLIATHPPRPRPPTLHSIMSQVLDPLILKQYITQKTLVGKLLGAAGVGGSGGAADLETQIKQQNATLQVRRIDLYKL
jgi:hypothetical protein